MKNILKEINKSNTLGKPPAFAYERISNKVQEDGRSLEAQEYGAKFYEKQNGLYIVHYFTVIESAWKEGREVFNQMLEMAERLGIKHIIFKNTDRMSRNYQDFKRITDVLIRNDISLHFYQTGRIINKDSSHDDAFILDIEIAVAKRHVEKISRDVRDANLFKAQKGIAPCKSPLGYIYNKVSKVHMINIDCKSDMNFIFDEFDGTRYSTRQFSELLNDKNIKTKNGRDWQHSTIHYLLTNPFYHGEFFYKGKLWNGNHEPYYDKERYEDRIERLGDKFLGTRNYKLNFKLARFIKCKCGTMFSGEMKKKQYLYYSHVCKFTKRRRYITENRIFQAIDKEVQSVVLVPEYANELKKVFKDFSHPKREDIKNKTIQLNRQINEFTQKKDKILDLYAESRIPQEEITRKINQYNKKVASLEKERKSISVSHDKFIFQVSDIIDTLRDLPKLYLEVSKEGKIEILRSISSGIVIDEQNIEVQWDKPYSFLIRPEILRYNKQDDSAVRSRPVMLPDRNKFRTVAYCLLILSVIFYTTANLRK